MELANIILGVISTLFLAAFGYLANHFVQSLRKEIRDVKEENRVQGEILFKMELDLNEAWFLIRRFTGKGGGRRKTRLTNAWRGTGYVSNTWSIDPREVADEPSAEEEDV